MTAPYVVDELAIERCLTTADPALIPHTAASVALRAARDLEHHDGPFVGLHHGAPVSRDAIRDAAQRVRAAGSAP